MTPPAPADATTAPPANPTTILHCSDLHFGHGFLPDRLTALSRAVRDIRPDLVAVSGDLTMRARPGQFADAARFLAEAAETTRVVAIPGNHDIPLYALHMRLTRPFAGYRRAVAPWSLEQQGVTVGSGGVELFGMNSIDPFRHQRGIMRPAALTAAVDWARTRPAGAWRVVMFHQHVADLPGHARPGRFPNAEPILRKLSEAGADAVLFGHAHYPHVRPAVADFPGLASAPPIALVQSGSATCARTRGPRPANAFNLLHFHADRLSVEVHAFKQNDGADCGGSFVPHETIDFPRRPAV